MTKATVDAGICGFTALIEVSRLSSQTLRVVVTSDWEMVSKMGEELTDIDWRDALNQREDCLLYKSLQQHIKHVACPIPIAILKAIEVEVGAALPRDVVIRFEPVSHRVSH
jgi:hypothetical protein